MSSSYLGWSERKPPRQFDTTRFDRDVLPGGPVSQGYESYVKSVFRPDAAPTRSRADLSQQLPIGASSLSGDPKVSASALLKLEQHLGKDALDDSNDHNLDHDLLPALYSELGVAASTPGYRQYPVYTPKQSSEYFTTRNAMPNPALAPANYRGSFRSYKPRNEVIKDTERRHLIDYQQFDNGAFSSPLSPYLYLSHEFVRPTDSRIVGSNFVQLTTRPRDSFLDKIDKTLADVRAMPRF